jgi:hypothetical protein
VINSITAGINKKSFFKGFLGRGSSQKNESKTKTTRTGSFVGTSGHLSNMQSAAMNMMFKNKNTGDKDIDPNRTYNRHFGKDITNKVLNSTGAISQHNQSDNDKNRPSMNMKSSVTRKPSPSIHSNYQNPTKERNIQP